MDIGGAEDCEADAKDRKVFGGAEFEAVAKEVGCTAAEEVERLLAALHFVCVIGAEKISAMTDSRNSKASRRTSASASLFYGGRRPLAPTSVAFRQISSGATFLS